MMISHEEEMFRKSFAVAIGLQEPVMPLPEEFQEDPEAFMKEYEKYPEEESEVY